MSSINKFSSIRWILGVLLGVVSTGVVYATGPINDTFSAGGTLTADNMNNIKNAVNDLQGNVPSTSCRTNAGAVDAGATRVGPLCVDNVRTGGSPTWTTAVNTCRAAGKRLLKPSEYIAAFNQGVITTTGNNQYEWVDAVSSDGQANAAAGSLAGRMRVGYMGPGLAADVGVDGDIFFATNVAYDAGFSIVFYRCAR